jgi:secondary thiamine-phosphate synthase enzyme
MKVYTKYVWFETKKRIEFINITQEIDSILKESKIKEGLVHINSMHITSGVYINDAENGLIEDIKEWLDKLAPKKDYKHHLTGEDNAQAHLKKMITGSEVNVPVTNGVLDFGTWEQIYYAEFDGQRKKRIIVKIIGY